MLPPAQLSEAFNYPAIRRYNTQATTTLHQRVNIYLCYRNRYVLSVEDLYVAFPNMYVPADFVRIQVMLEFEYLRWLY
jgi:hypothetical protein